MTNNYESGILLVDDHQMMLDGVKSLLNEAGYKNIFTSLNSENALKILESQKDKIKLIVTDINRPGTNGIDFIKAISSKHNYIVGIIIFSMLSPKTVFQNPEEFKLFKGGLNPINIVEFNYILKHEPTSDQLLKICENSLRSVTKERIRQKRLSENEKVGFQIENNKIKIIGLASDSSLEIIDNKGHQHILSYTYGFESTRIKHSIEELEFLINKGNVRESELQAFFNTNPDFLVNDDYKQVHPHMVLKDKKGKKLIPDYVIEPINQFDFTNILDLKLPKTRVIVSSKRPRYSAAILQVCSQLREYSTFFESEQNRKKIIEKYGLTIFNPNMIAIIGRRKNTDPILYKKLQRDIPELKIKTYDDIIDKMKYRIK